MSENVLFWIVVLKYFVDAAVKVHARIFTPRCT